jgi:DNA-binding MarR family transcriptional regulator
LPGKRRSRTIGPAVAASRVARWVHALPLSQRHALVFLLLRCNGKWQTRIGQEKLALEVGIHVTTLRRALNALCQEGWIDWYEIRCDRGYRKLRHYTVNKTKVLALVEEKS